MNAAMLYTNSEQPVVRPGSGMLALRAAVGRLPCLAVTGGIACGKSAFGSFLAESGADVADADSVVHRLQEAGTDLSRLIGEEFGSVYIGNDGAVDRKRLGALVFADKQARLRLESLVHPLVREWFRVWRSEPSRAWAKVALIPLLYESGWEKDWDGVICVTCELEIQLRRLQQRGFSKTEAQRRIESQWSNSEKSRKADYVIHNDRGLEQLAAAAENLKKIILER